MTQEDKELLLKDLCARLPYHPIVHAEHDIFGLIETADLQVYGYEGTIKLLREDNETFCYLPIEECKPYLRPMSSMTDEEKKQYGELCDEDIRQLTSVPILHPGLKYKTSCHRSIIWLLEHQFDIMGLIPKGLAIEVTEENNPYKD